MAKQNNTQIALILGVVLILALLFGQPLFQSIGLGYSNASNRPDLTTLQNNNLAYGQPLIVNFVIQENKEMVRFGNINQGQVLRQYGMASVSLSDLMIVVDGKFIAKGWEEGPYKLDSGPNCGDYGPGDVPNGGYRSDRKFACIYWNTSSQFGATSIYDGPSILPTGDLIAKINISQHLSPGNHVLQIYWLGTPGGIETQPVINSPILTPYGQGYAGFDQGGKFVSYINFTVVDTTSPAVCSGITKGAFCVVPAGLGCAAGEYRDGEVCIYPLIQPTIPIQERIIYQNNTVYVERVINNTVYLESQVNNTVYVPTYVYIQNNTQTGTNIPKPNDLQLSQTSLILIGVGILLVCGILFYMTRKKK